MPIFTEGSLLVHRSPVRGTYLTEITDFLVVVSTQGNRISLRRPKIIDVDGRLECDPTVLEGKVITRTETVNADGLHSIKVDGKQFY